MEIAIINKIMCGDKEMDRRAKEAASTTVDFHIDRFYRGITIVAK